MSKHTPGPWVWTGTELERDSPDDQYCPVIELGIVDGKQTLFMTDADRALIAAAPEMLEALEDLLEYGIGASVEKTQQAIAAIAKARGEE